MPITKKKQKKVVLLKPKSRKRTLLQNIKTPTGLKIVIVKVLNIHNFNICLPLLVFIGPPRIASTSFKVQPSEMLWIINTKINYNHQNTLTVKYLHNYCCFARHSACPLKIDIAMSINIKC